MYPYNGPPAYTRPTERVLANVRLCILHTYTYANGTFHCTYRFTVNIIHTPVNNLPIPVYLAVYYYVCTIYRDLGLTDWQNLRTNDYANIVYTYANKQEYDWFNYANRTPHTPTYVAVRSYTGNTEKREKEPKIENYERNFYSWTRAHKMWKIVCLLHSTVEIPQVYLS